MYGGNRQSGISPSAKSPYIFIFSAPSGRQFGYKDEWLNEDVFSYSGEGQKGDMQFTKGNLALRDHLINQKKVLLFEYIAKGTVRFVCNLSFLDCDFFETHDNAGLTRMGIKFFFERSGTSKYMIPNELKLRRTLSDPKEKYADVLKPSPTERKGLITSRVGQGAYRKSILHRWSYRCAATGFRDIRVLIASHIQPWRKSSDDERLDVDNGILLSPDYDALFDKHLISFENSGKIVVSEKFVKGDLLTLGITGNERVQGLSEGNKTYLEKHRQSLK